MNGFGPEREQPRPLEARPNQAVAAIIFDQKTNSMYTVVETNSRPEYGKMAGMCTIPMETINPGEDPDQQTLPRLFQEEVKIYEDIKILRTEYVGYYGIGEAAARLYLCHAERNGISRNENSRSHSVSTYDVVDPIWMTREEIARQWVRMGVAEMLEDFFSGERDVITECKPVPLVRVA